VTDTLFPILFDLHNDAACAEPAAELARDLVAALLHGEADLVTDAINEALVNTDDRVPRAYLLMTLASLAVSVACSRAPEGPQRLADTILSMRTTGRHINWTPLP